MHQQDDPADDRQEQEQQPHGGPALVVQPRDGRGDRGHQGQQRDDARGVVRRLIMAITGGVARAPRG
jgi:hypothetical protein